MPLTAHRTRALVPQVVPTFQVMRGDGNGNGNGEGCTAKGQCMTCHAEDSYTRFTQNVKFQIDVRSFDVYENEGDVSCLYDYLEVDGQSYCGTNGPQGIWPDSALVWKPGWSVLQGLESSFTICPVSRQPPRP